MKEKSLWALLYQFLKSLFNAYKMGGNLISLKPSEKQNCWLTLIQIKCYNYMYFFFFFIKFANTSKHYTITPSHLALNMAIGISRNFNATCYIEYYYRKNFWFKVTMKWIILPQFHSMISVILANNVYLKNKSYILFSSLPINNNLRRSYMILWINTKFFTICTN